MPDFGDELEAIYIKSILRKNQLELIAKFIYRAKDSDELEELNYSFRPGRIDSIDAKII